MAAITLSKKSKQKLRELGVALVYLFGSRATDHYHALSDVDIGVVVRNTEERLRNQMDFYLKVYEILSEDIPDHKEGPKLDISLLQKANPALVAKAISEGRILMETDANFRADFEEYAIKKYNDYLPFKREYEDATLKAFS